MTAESSLFGSDAGKGPSNVHFSSAAGDWRTPEAVFGALDAEFGFDLDACATPATALRERFFSPAEDALLRPWEGIVFCNPPYGREIGRWILKARAESLLGATVVMLVPARTDTAWWHDHAMKGEVRFLRGRLRFGGARHNAPFPSAVIVFRPPNGRSR